MRLRKAKTTRAQRGAARVAATWADKFSEAGAEPAKRAAVTWDQLRAAIKKLPLEDQPTAWRRTANALEKIRDGLAT